MVESLRKLTTGQSLDRSESRALMRGILLGDFAPEQMRAFLIALHCKGETSPELVGFVQALQETMRTVTLTASEAVDVCGTGGDGLGTFNVSTCVAFVVAAAGVPVAKHGNRAVSSRSGSFDVLNALGVASCEDEAQAQQAIQDFGLAFMFAPSFHPTLSKVAALRRSLGVRTVFNLLGPLLNPARVGRQLVGVFDSKYLGAMAETLRELGSREAMVVCGDGGLDEISVTGVTQVAHLKDSEICFAEITPEQYGFKRAAPESLKGGDAALNARIMVTLFEGEKGSPRDLVVLNAAAALAVSGVTRDLREGVEIAQAALDSGATLTLLNRVRQHHQVRTGT